MENVKQTVVCDECCAADSEETSDFATRKKIFTEEEGNKKKYYEYRCPKCLKEISSEEKICPNCGSLLFFDEESNYNKRLRKASELSSGQKLLRERELLFEDIFKENRINEIIKYFAFWSFIFSSIYGLSLGIYSGFFQMVIGAAKVPALLFLSLAVCAPPLYTFNVLLGSKLSFKQILSMLCMKTYMISIILISFSPVAAFFIITGGNHDFITLLNVSFFGIAGCFGVTLLWNGMKYVTVKNGYEPNQIIITVWIFIYMFVGLQLAWTLRPFIGEKNSFAMFRQIGGNIYVYLGKLLTGM